MKRWSTTEAAQKSAKALQPVVSSPLRMSYPPFLRDLLEFYIPSGGYLCP